MKAILLTGLDIEWMLKHTPVTDVDVIRVYHAAKYVGVAVLKDDVAEVVEWCRESCKSLKDFDVVSGLVAFESDEDAIMYTLRWS